jgi:hypothetical protein
MNLAKRPRISTHINNADLILLAHWLITLFSYLWLTSIIVYFNLFDSQHEFSTNSQSIAMILTGLAISSSIKTTLDNKRYSYTAMALIGLFILGALA